MLFPTEWQTIRLVLTVPQELPSGGWGWVTHPEGDPVGTEFVYNCGELRKAFKAWGPMVARVLVGPRWDRFNLTAYGVVSGNVLGRDAWVRSAETGRLIPHGTPFCTWERARFPTEVPRVAPLLVARCCNGQGPEDFRRAA